MKNDYKIDGNKIIIYMPYKKREVIETFISLDDLPKLKAIDNSWGAQYCKLSNSYYVSSTINRKTLFLHRFLFDFPEGYDIDHINHNTLDNRRENLRKVTHAENQQNRSISKNNVTGIRGVYWEEKRKTFAARIKINKKIVFNKRFKYIEDAESAIIAARKELMPFATN